jgi:diaminohydroxyphosphoribosylaminopyrimidine deaminase/5-amino-6-(5-phosphoribosylamino)uracil reductase
MTRRDPPVDLAWMDLAFDLAEAGRYTVSPNPMVGAVLVKGGRVVGKGFHRRAGGPHAEARWDRREAGERADLYDARLRASAGPALRGVIVASGARRVAARDPNPWSRHPPAESLPTRAGPAAAGAQNEKFRVWTENGGRS